MYRRGVMAKAKSQLCVTMIALIGFAVLLSAAMADADNDLKLRISGKGDFIADNGRIILYRWLKHSKASYTQRYRLEFDLKWVAGFCGPVFRPLLGKLGNKMKIEESLNLSTGSATDQGEIPNSAIGYTRTVKESAGGILVDVKLNQDCFNREAKYAYLMWLFNGDMLKGRKLLWGKKTFTIPRNVGNKRLLSDPQNSVKNLRISLTDNIDLGIVLLDGFKDKILYQLKSRKNRPEIKKVDSVFELRAVMKGHDARYFAILLHPKDKIPSIKDILTASKPKTKPIKKGNLIKQGASFETGPYDGFCSYNLISHRNPISRFKPYPQPEIVSNTSKDGQHSLCIREPAVCGVVFNPVKLELGKPYTLSMWMKAEKPKAAVSAIIGLKGEQIKRNFSLTRKWKRYSFTFTPKKFTFLGHFPIRIANMKGRDSTFWLDGIQLEEGKLTGYAPAAKLEMGAAVLKKYRLIEAGEHSIVNLYFRNNSEKSATGKVSYAVKDYWENTVRADEISLKTIPAQGNSLQTLDLGKLPRGYYRAYFTASWGEKEEVIWGVYKPQPLLKVSSHWPFGAHGICGEEALYRQIGFGWMRCFFGWHFRNLMPKPDMKEMDFSRADKYLELADKAKINLLPVLEMGYAEKTFTSKYGWIKNWWKSDKLSKKKHAKFGRNYLPQEELWKNYIYDTVYRYKGKITYWEVTNESNTNLFPEEYVKLLKTAYEAAKKANPACKIVGICSTSDMGGEPLPYTRRVLNLGGWKFLDAVSIHVYGNQPPEIHHDGEDKLFNMIKDICARHGKKIEVWNTEKNSASINSGYSAHKFNVPPVQHYHQARRILTFKDKGEYFIREGIITSSIGNGPFFWHCLLPNKIQTNFITHFGPYVNGPNYFEFDFAPRPELIAVNGFASLLAPDMSGAGVVDWGELNRCSLFASKGDTVAAIWNWKENAIAEIPVKNSKFELYNYFGESIKIQTFKTGILQVNLESAPKYLVFRAMPPEDARKILEKTNFPGAKQFDASAKLAWHQNTAILAVTVKNLSKYPLNANINISSLPKNWYCPDKYRKIEKLLSGKNITVNFGPLKVYPLSTGGIITASVKTKEQTENIMTHVLPVKSVRQVKTMLDRRSIILVENRLDKPVKIDGDLTEWQNSPAVWITDSRGDRHWNNVKDSSCMLALGWNNDFLYFAIRVFDDKIDNNSKDNKMLWNGDAIELFLNLDFSDDKPGQNVVDYRMSKDDFHAAIAPKTLKSNNAAIWWKYLASNGNTKLMSKHLPDGYAIEGAIPWKNLKERYPFVPEKGKQIGFTFILSDRDGNVSVRKRLVWHGNQGVNKSPDTWGKALFK